MALPPANANAHRSVCLDDGGARPIAIWANRSPNARAQRRSAGHELVSSRVTCHAQTRARTARLGSPTSSHNVRAIAMAA